MNGTEALSGVDTQTLPRDAEIPALTGLRFLAAISVVLAHGAQHIWHTDPPGQIEWWLTTAAGYGMTSFFVLSGFVIHYNYRHLVTAGGWPGVGAFLWARFTRLYPLFLLMLALEAMLGHRLLEAMFGSPAPFIQLLQALPYYLLFVQSWIYVPFADHSLIHAAGANLSLTWSVSTEWFFYLAYPVLAPVLLRLRRPVTIAAAWAGWVVLWGGMASALDGQAGAFDAWAVGRYGPLAGMANGMADSFVQWLLYFSPYLRIGEFLLGCLTAQLYLRLRDRPPIGREYAIGPLILLAGLASVPLALYLTFSTAHGAPLLFSLRFNFALAPSAAIILFAAARYRSAVGRVLGSRPLVDLGEASYSIYLTHFPVLVVLSSTIGEALPPAGPALLYLALRLVVALALICLVSLGLLAVVEVPARRWLRGMRYATGRRGKAAVASIVALPVAAALVCGAVGADASSDGGRDIELIDATYGANCGAPSGNATQALAAACNARDRCDYSVDVAVLGDPASGCGKDFIVDYRCARGTAPRRASLPAEAGFGSHVTLDCH